MGEGEGEKGVYHSDTKFKSLILFGYEIFVRGILTGAGREWTPAFAGVTGGVGDGEVQGARWRSSGGVRCAMNAHPTRRGSWIGWRGVGVKPRGLPSDRFEDRQARLRWSLARSDCPQAQAAGQGV